MITFMDNFVSYAPVQAVSASMDQQYLLRQYTSVNTSAANTGYVLANSVATVPYQRPVLRTSTANTTNVSRQLLYPIGLHFPPGGGRVTQGLKLADMPINNTDVNRYVLGIVHRVGETTNTILSVGFINNNTAAISYVEREVIDDEVVRTVRRRTFNLDAPLSGSFDTVEWSVQKIGSNVNTYTEFVLWVNNRVVAVENIFCNVGEYTEIFSVVHGNFSVLSNGTTGATVDQGFITGVLAITAQVYGVTDLYMTNSEGPRHTSRLGKVYVTRRTPVADASPNQFTKSEEASSSFALNAEVVAQTPPDSTKFLLSPDSGSQDMYGALAFPGLGSEAVLAVMDKALVLKNDPAGNDVVLVTRVGGTEYMSDSLGVGTQPTFANNVREVNPATGLPWLAVEANNAQFGLMTD